MLRSAFLAAVAWLIAWTPIHAQVVDVWPGVAPGSERWTQQERTIEGTPVGTVVLNVVKPTITAYLPEPSRATGAGVIVAPGGAFVALAMSLEATDLAKWLQHRGVAAFVLKYRTIEKHEGGVPQLDMDTAGRYGIADGIQALKVVRAHAPAWGIDRNRLGMIGFSAGAMVTSAAMLQRDPTLRPNFVALVYGAPFGRMPAIPAGLPPVFMAWAKDDPVALFAVVKLHDALVATGQPPETHVYAKGGHGFGMKKQGTDSDHWIDDYAHWLRAHGVIR
jgi:acetyl esterase/lipase